MDLCHVFEVSHPAMEKTRKFGDTGHDVTKDWFPIFGLYG